MNEFEKLFESSFREYFESGRKYAQILWDYVKLANRGKEIVIATTTNNYGEEIPISKIFISRTNNGVRFMEWRLSCMSSAEYGLGTCQCVTHDPVEVVEISFERFVGYLIRKSEEDAKRKFKEKFNEKLWNEFEKVVGRLVVHFGEK